ncbi:LEF-5 [Penaeus vannamei nudivirus]|nr:hypothetical protein PvSNPV_036 [Penaeus vannamei nucleopolyhedrovirus]
MEDIEMWEDVDQEVVDEEEYDVKFDDDDDEDDENDEEEDDPDNDEEDEQPQVKRGGKTKIQLEPHKKINFSKLCVIYDKSEHIMSQMEMVQNMVIVKFDNYAFSVPNVKDVAKSNLKPCPPIDTSEVITCKHTYVITQEQTRKGDELFTVLKKCTKCGVVSS